MFHARIIQGTHDRKEKRVSINNLGEPNIAIFFLSVFEPTNVLHAWLQINCMRSAKGNGREVRKVDGKYLRR